MTQYFFFFFNDTATTEIYTLSLHDALPICLDAVEHGLEHGLHLHLVAHLDQDRSEEHTSELQSPCNLVCRLLLEKKKKYIIIFKIFYISIIQIYVLQSFIASMTHTITGPDV